MWVGYLHGLVLMYGLHLHHSFNRLLWNHPSLGRPLTLLSTKTIFFAASELLQMHGSSEWCLDPCLAATFIYIFCLLRAWAQKWLSNIILANFIFCQPSSRNPSITVVLSPSRAPLGVQPCLKRSSLFWLKMKPLNATLSHPFLDQSL